ncbi:MAG: adenine nucleotide alpha hydrolase family protein [Prevotella sp.]|nr:adenine nucleotide alpha hydrolase family protein [Prevotella sp.]
MQLSEELKLERRVVSRFHKAISDYQLICDGDSVLVALSGGKDSLCLLELLARQSHVYRPKFRLEAVHVRMDNIHYETDTSYLERFCKRLDVKLHVLTTRFETESRGNSNETENVSANEPASGDGQYASKAALRKQKTPCFLCSWYRRKAIFNLAQTEGFNKIALGHHQDDILHTTLMNLFFQGRFEGMPVALTMKKMALTIIRPLCLELESDLKAFARLNHYEQQLKTCPYEHDTHRSEIAKLYQQVERMNCEARYSIWHALAKASKLTEVEEPKEY